MDKFINEKWRGRIEINATIMDFSTGYALLQDKRKIFGTDDLFSELPKSQMQMNKQNLTHIFKFFVWKSSMFLRYSIEFGFSLLITLMF